MPRYTDDSRERVRDAVDFAEIVGARTELRPSGPNRLTGLCPFHDERTPSFGIDPGEKVYHCFGCGAGGDVFTFVMETEHVGFGEALELLAERAGIELEREAEDPEAARRRQAEDRLHAVLERAAAFYVRLLWESAEAEPARAYLAGRGLEEAVLRTFRVGWSPTGWDRVTSASQRAGYSVQELLDAGLTQRRRDGSGLLDRFRGRIMFPLADHRGRVLGFGARTLDPDQPPKYLNTSESRIFHKGAIVYGHDLARAEAARAGAVVLCEGYTDVIALHQAGIRHAVASMGTALTDQQADKLSQMAPKVLLCMDPDAAGREAMARASELLGKRRAELRVVALPRGQDPADLVASQGAAALTALLERPEPLPVFEFERVVEAADLGSPQGREAAADELRPIIGALPEGPLRQDLMRRTSDELGLPPDVVASMYRTPGRFRPPTGRGPGRGGGGGGGGRPNGDGPPPPREPANQAWSRVADTERAFLARCLAARSAGRAALEAMDLDAMFSTPVMRRAADYLVEHLEEPGRSLPHDDEELARVVADLVIRAGTLTSDGGVLELERLQLEMMRVDRAIAAARRAGEPIEPLARERGRIHDEIRHRLV